MVAPPDQHLVVTDDGTLSLLPSPRVNFVRPSADLLFESIAAVYGGSFRCPYVQDCHVRG